MSIPAADHQCPAYKLRVLTGKIVYRLSEHHSDWAGGPCVRVQQISPDGELGPRELISLRELDHLTQYIETSPCQSGTTPPSA